MNVEMEHILEATVFEPGLDLASHVGSQEDGLGSRMLGNTHEHTRVRVGRVEGITPAKLVEQVTAKSLWSASRHVHLRRPRLCGSG